MELNVANIALIVAAAQGFLLVVLIVQKYQSLFANRFLALLLLCYTIILVHLLLQDAGLYRIVPYVFLIVGLPFLAMPLHYLYTKYLITRKTTFAASDWIHLVPFLMFEIILISASLFSMIDLTAVATVEPAATPVSFRIVNWLIIAQGLMYLGLSYRLLTRYNAHIKDVLSSIEQVQLQWLRNITTVGLIAVMIFLIEDLLMAQGINLSNFIFSSIFFAVYVYGIGYTGFLKSEIFVSPIVEQTMHEVEIIESEVRPVAKYERSGLSHETAQQYLAQLLALMENERPYFDPSVTLTRLAEKLSITPHNLSEVINSQLNKNFYDFINGYRIEQIKKDLADPAKQHLKILSIAFDAGFNSKATFNTLFKEQIGKTPSEYRKSVLKTISEE